MENHHKDVRIKRFGHRAPFTTAVDAATAAQGLPCFCCWRVTGGYLSSMKTRTNARRHTAVSDLAVVGLRITRLRALSSANSQGYTQTLLATRGNGSEVVLEEQGTISSRRRHLLSIVDEVIRHTVCTGTRRLGFVLSIFQSVVLCLPSARVAASSPQYGMCSLERSTRPPQ